MKQKLPEPMLQAFAQAQAAAKRGEVPVGAVVVDADGKVIASAGNRTLELKDPTAHAELLAIRANYNRPHRHFTPHRRRLCLGKGLQHRLWKFLLHGGT